MMDTNPPKSGLKYDATITLGSMISSATIIVGLAVGWTQLQAQNAETERRVQRVEAQAITTMAAIEGNRRDVEGRVRANELTIAGQSSDLRNIQVGINEIKTAISRLNEDGTRP